jgi:hypothetical protein
MKTEFLKGLGLEKEAIDKIMAENGKDIELEKGKAKDLQTQLDTANNTIKERDKQLEDLKNSPDNPETLKQQIQQLQNDNKKAKETHDAEIKQLKVNNALEKALTGAKAKNAKAVKALLELGNDIELLEDGTIKGLDEKIKELKKSDAYLFEADVKKTKINGTKPGERIQNNPEGGKPLSEMTYEDFLAEINEEN